MLPTELEQMQKLIDQGILYAFFSIFFRNVKREE